MQLGSNVATQVRPLLVDSRLKEYTIGLLHDVTDRLFMVRRVFRVIDALPQGSAARWQWQRGWLLVDHLRGRISPLNLPEFDPFYSAARWYRDYAAYCGVSEGKKLFALVAEIGRREAILRKTLGKPAGLHEPDSECPDAGVGARAPVRVTVPTGGTIRRLCSRFAGACWIS